MTALDVRKAVQEALCVTPDGEIGSETMQALSLLCQRPDDSQWPAAPADTGGTGLHAVLASDFADPSDVAAFKKCKANGGSDQECFRIGDNGIGASGQSTAEGTGPSCALPPEEWSEFRPNQWGKLVLITNPGNGKSVTAKLLDTMPHLANIENGCGIDLNPDAVAALGLTIPVKAPVTWEWVA